MSNFAAFMAQNVAKIENKKIVVSDRFKDENGKAMKWEIKALTEAENNELQRKAMIQVPVAGRRGMFTREVDQIKYTQLLLAASVVYPNLNDAELQNSWGVMTPEDLIGKMLYPNEAAKLAKEVMAYAQIENLSDAVEEAKN